MSDVNRSIRITIDSGGAPKKIKELQEEMAALQAQLGGLNRSEANYTEQSNKLKAQLAQKEKALTDYNHKVSETDRLLKNLGGATLNELIAQKRALQRQLGNLSRDSKEYAETQRQLNRVTTELSSAQGTQAKGQFSLNSLVKLSSVGFGVLGVAAHDLAQKVLGAVKSFFDFEKIMMSAQKSGDAMAANLAGMSSAVEELRQRIATADWSNFTQGMVDAFAAGKELAKAMDELFELRNSLRLNQAEQSEELETQRQRMQDQRLSDQERLDAGRAYLEMTQEQGRKRAEIDTKEYEDMNKYFKTRTKMNDEQLEFFITNYQNNQKLIEQAQEYIRVEEYIAMREQVSGENAMIRKRIRQKELLEETKGLKEAVEAFKRYNEGTNDDMVKKWVDARVQMLNTNTQTMQENRRIVAQTNALEQKLNEERTKAGVTATAEAQKRLKAELRTRIEAQEEATRAERHRIQQSYLDGEVSHAIHLHQLEELEMAALRQKLDIMGLEESARRQLEDKIYEYAIKMRQQAAALPIPTTELPKTADPVREEQRINAKLKGVMAERTADQQAAYEEQQATVQQYSSVARGAAESFGDIIGGFISDSETAAQDFQFNMLLMALDTLQQMVLIWSAELFGKMTAKLGPIAGPIAAAAGTALIQGVFSGVKGAIKRPSTKLSSNEVAGGVTTSSAERTVKGFSEGGFTGGGGIVHENEYVVPQWMMQQPATMDLVRVLEAQRRTQSSANPLPGFSEGGFTGGRSAAVVESSTGGGALLTTMERVGALLESLERNGVKAPVVLSELERKQELRRRSKEPFRRG